MTPDAAPFCWPIRVYWEDTDAGGVVFYANYLKFFERARTEWLRHLGRADPDGRVEGEDAAGAETEGFSQQALREQTGAIFIVSHTEVRHLAPARLDDALRITVQLTDCGRATMTFAQQAWCGPRLLAEGTIRVGCVDASSWKPRRLPPAVLTALERQQLPPPELTVNHPPP